MEHDNTPQPLTVYNYETLKRIVEKGDLEALKYHVEVLGIQLGEKLYENHDRRYGEPCSIALIATSRGRLDCLRYCHEHGDIIKTNCYDFAVLAQSKECFNYLLEIKIKKNASTCTNAARIGSLELLKLAHEAGFGMIWQATHAALENNHLECVKYAMENGTGVDFTLVAQRKEENESYRYVYETYKHIYNYKEKRI